MLYTLSSAGRLYTLDVATATRQPVGHAAPVTLPGRVHGVDFNPAADRVRVVSDSGLNLRLHPDTGAMAATDPALHDADGDPRAGQAPRIAAAGYTDNKRDDKATTNDAIDIAAGTLAALRHGGRTQLYRVDLASGRATALGSIGDGRALRGIAIEP